MTSLIETWDLTGRLTSATGGECVGDTLRSEIAVPKNYSLVLTRTGSNVDATLESTTGDFACTFTGLKGESDGFADGRYYWCAVGDPVLGFPCQNGQRRRLLPFGASFTGRVAADGTMTADLNADWEVGYPDLPFRDIADMETTTEYRGSRDDR